MAYLSNDFVDSYPPCSKITTGESIRFWHPKVNETRCLSAYDDAAGWNNLTVTTQSFSRQSTTENHQIVVSKVSGACQQRMSLMSTT